MPAGGQPPQHGGRFALRTGGHHRDAVGRQLAHLRNVDEQVGGQFQVAQPLGNLHIVAHRPAGDRQFAPVFGRRIPYLLNTRNQRGKAGHNHPPLRLAEQIVEGGGNHLFRRRPAGTLSVGAVGQQSQHAALRELGQLGKVRRPVVYRGVVKLVVTGMHN